MSMTLNALRIKHGSNVMYVMSRNREWMRVSFIFNVTGFNLKKAKTFKIKTSEVPKILQIMELAGAI